ncbi:hypothetical protein GPECTOR_50g655 [Gonium pectorale]|uniref:Uncharacterized protein n=1 Tax=Gonium pectorale TaxID=33097 RepID=A0A150G7R6_GONPE|nr:hypothetical protein GPECTOR_50g655 [Gonium pectorale]|eukprot:KXZ45861.1 hypothetical protein GPECTOR_50g655 [Gonium pectorale]
MEANLIVRDSGPVHERIERRASHVIKETASRLQGLQEDADRGEALMAELEALLAASRESTAERGSIDPILDTSTMLQFSAIAPLRDDDEEEEDGQSQLISPAPVTSDAVGTTRNRSGRFMTILKGIFHNDQRAAKMALQATNFATAAAAPTPSVGGQQRCPSNPSSRSGCMSPSEGPSVHFGSAFVADNPASAALESCSSVPLPPGGSRQCSFTATSSFSRARRPAQLVRGTSFHVATLIGSADSPSGRSEDGAITLPVRCRSMTLTANSAASDLQAAVAAGSSPKAAQRGASESANSASISGPAGLGGRANSRLSMVCSLPPI